MPNTEIIRTVETNQQVGDTTVQEKAISSAEVVDQREHILLKMVKFIWFISHFIAIVLGLRFIFLMLGANTIGIVQVIYDLGGAFILPFRGIFPSPTTGEYYFDSAALLAIAMYYLFAFLIIKALELLFVNASQKLS